MDLTYKQIKKWVLLLLQMSYFSWVFSRLFPIFKTLTGYNKALFLNDLTSGITVAVLVVPQAMAYAIIAGLPPIYGLYAALIPQLIHGLMGTSRHPAVGPVALDSLLVAVAIGSLSLTGIENIVAATLFMAMTVGALQILMGVLHMGILTNYLSRPVISGFTSAAAIIIGLSQVKHILGIDISSSNKIQKVLGAIFQNFENINPVTLLVGASAMTLILISKKYFKKLPSALVVTFFGILLMKLTRWDLHGVDIVGSVPAGLPSFYLHTVSIDLFKDIFPYALTLAVIGYMEIVSITKELEEKEEKYDLKSNQELIALGSANFIGSFFQSFPVSASFSRSAVKFQAGAKTGMSAIITSALVGLTLLFFTSLFYFLPIAVLAGIIMVAAFHLINVRYAIELFKTRKDEFYLLIITCLLTLVVGIVQGMVIGVLLSLLLMVIRTSNPHYAILARVSGTKYYKNISRFESNIDADNDLLILRFDAQLFFGNRDYFRKVIMEEVQKKKQLKGFVLVARGITYIDSSGLSTLSVITKWFQERDILFMIAGAIGPTRDVLQKSKLTKLIKEENLFAKTADAVDFFKGQVTPTNVQKEIARQTNE